MIQTIKIDDYMLERLLNLNKEMHPYDGDDLTLTIGLLIAEHKQLIKIKEMI